MLTKNINNENQSWSIIFGLWLIYFCFGYSVSSIAPIVPYITHDLNISYKQMGLIYDLYNNFNIALTIYSIIMFIMLLPLLIIRKEK